ncbi:MAG: hypothetical protein FE048_03140 [Thermoplasmata archaeon]|nr:MAG: hypothetical protein FE048_03140 [Thermoplasmata archaeon]
MKKKVISIMVFVLLAMGGVASIAEGIAKKSDIPQPEMEGEKFHAVEASAQFKEPYIIEEEDYAVVVIDGMKSHRSAEYPMLPYTTKVMTFPLGTKIESIEVKTSEIKIIQLSKKIKPAPEPISLNMENAKVEIKEGSIYESNEPYPSDWITYNIGVGIENGKHVVFLSIHAFPCRYIPASNELLYTNEMEIKVSYTPPEKPLLQNDVYDLVIIAPSQYSDALQPLVEHKENHGIKTKLVTTDEVYGSVYFPSQGRDDAERIKYFIKNAIEEWGIKYVLLAGGLSSPIKSTTWLVPVRYSRLAHGDEKFTLCDLYFADIYKYEDGNITFDDWDSNGNGIIAEWSGVNKDILDLHPDVYVGRLACRTMKEVNTVVEKIIKYENECDPSWFKRVVLAGGDTFNDISGNNFLEGEIANQKVAEYLDDFEAEKIWWSEGKVNQKNMVEALGKGCGFVHLSGHGSPGVWFVKDYIQNPHGKYIWALDVYHIPLLQNGDKLPIVVIGGCHNSMFNTSLYASTTDVIKTIIIKYILGKPYLSYYWIPIPECQGWWFVKQSGGGAIATFGCTGYGLGTVGDSDRDGIPDCIQYLLTWLELRFFKLYAEDGIDVLGETWGNAISDYANTFDCNKNSGDRKTVEDWVLLGDPSLKIGGYS